METSAAEYRPAGEASADPAPGMASLAGRQNFGDRLFFGGTAVAALFAPAVLVVFVAVLFYGAWPSIKAFRFSFLTSGVWEPNPARETYGALPFIVGTLISSVLAV